jgi:hypothetical protein
MGRESRTFERVDWRVPTEMRLPKTRDEAIARVKLIVDAGQKPKTMWGDPVGKWLYREERAGELTAHDLSIAESVSQCKVMVNGHTVQIEGPRTCAEMTGYRLYRMLDDRFAVYERSKERVIVINETSTVGRPAVLGNASGRPARRSNSPRKVAALVVRVVIRSGSVKSCSKPMLEKRRSRRSPSVVAQNRSRGGGQRCP